ncbi:unnamed protein product, partial [Mesorhabditis belari]|uniref:Uncharacterized protein n=1 Tax=Mesorhabditis belari TaxID=2138241 RepID=A0AAF3ES47_9BILA
MYLTSLFEDRNETLDVEQPENFEGWLLVSDSHPSQMPRPAGQNGDYERWNRGYCVGRGDDYSLICYKNEQQAHTLARDVPKTRLDGGASKFMKHWRSQERQGPLENTGTMSRAQRMFNTLSRMTSLKDDDRLVTDCVPELSRKFSISTLRLSRKKS